MLSLGAVLLTASPLHAGSALLGASTGRVDPPQSVSTPGTGGSAALLAVVLLLLAVGSVWAVRRWRLARLPPLTPAESRADWPLLLIGGLAVLLAQPIGAGLARAIVSLPSDQSTGLPGTALLAVGGSLGAAVAIVVLGSMARGLFRRIGADPQGRDLALGVIGILLAAPVVLLVGQVALALAAWAARLTGRPGPDPTAHATLRLLTEGPGQWGGWWWALVLAVVAGAPVVEEVVYRGFLQSACRSVTRSRWGAVLAASGVFTLMHAGVAEAHALAVLFVLSVAFGIAYERTGRLWVPITMHALFNAGNLAGALLAAE